MPVFSLHEIPSQEVPSFTSPSHSAHRTQEAPGLKSPSSNSSHISRVISLPREVSRQSSLVVASGFSRVQHAPFFCWSQRVGEQAAADCGAPLFASQALVVSISQVAPGLPGTQQGACFSVWTVQTIPSQKFLSLMGLSGSQFSRFIPTAHWLFDILGQQATGFSSGGQPSDRHMPFFISLPSPQLPLLGASAQEEVFFSASHVQHAGLSEGHSLQEAASPLYSPLNCLHSVSVTVRHCRFFAASVPVQQIPLGSRQGFWPLTRSHDVTPPTQRTGA